MAVMTAQVLKDICRERDLYESPQLNSKLYLQFRGFHKIESLDPYLNVKALFLENNAIAKIENLDRMKDLACLCLHQNRIEKIENLAYNVNIQRLNLSANFIRKIENISHLQLLKDLDLSHNKLTTLDREVLELGHLENFDVSFNEIQTSDEVIALFAKMKELRQLKFCGNPGMQRTANFRQRMINEIPRLQYLNDRPVFQVERVSSRAWAEGGRDAERKAKSDFIEKQQRVAPTDDWDERKHKVSERMRRTLQRISTQNGPADASPSLNSKSVINAHDSDPINTKIILPTETTVSRATEDVNSKSEELCTLQFDDVGFHAWQQDQFNQALASESQTTAGRMDVRDTEHFAPEWSSQRTHHLHPPSLDSMD